VRTNTFAGEQRHNDSSLYVICRYTTV